jgi:hypothetical protein
MEELSKRARATRPEKAVLGAMAMRKSTRDEMNEQRFEGNERELKSRQL